MREYFVLTGKMILYLWNRSDYKKEGRKMITKVITSIVGYAFTKGLEKYNWQTIYENSKNDILSTLEKQDVDRVKSIAKVFEDKRIKEYFCSLNIKVGYGFSKTLRKKLYGIFSDFAINEDDKKYYIEEFIKDVNYHLKELFPDVSRDLFFEEAVFEAMKCQQELTDKILRQFADAKLKIYNIWQYDSFIRRSNKYNIDLDFFDYGEDDIDKKILDEISSKDRIYVKVQSREEGLYYLLRLLKNQTDFNDNVFVITDLSSWNSLEGKVSGKILIPYFYAEETIPLITQNTVVHVLDNGINKPNKEIVEIPNRTKQNLSHCLSKYISDYNEVVRLMETKISTFSILKRELFEGNFPEPEWAGGDMRLLVPAILSGSWSDKAGDKEIIELLSEKGYEEYIAELQRHTNTAEPFLISYNNSPYKKYQVADLQQAWFYVAKYITNGHLETFELALEEVIHDVDSKIENGIRTVECGTYSAGLKKGLVKSLIYMNLYSDEYPNLGSKSSKFVRQILKNADWDNIAELLPELVEAAPNAFIMAVEHAINNQESSFWDLFKAQGKEFFAYVNYPQLLFALEKGLFIDEIRVDCIKVLEDLCAAKVDGKMLNSPIHTLSSLFCAFFDEPNIGEENRVKLLSVFIKKDSGNAWLLIKNILPKNLQGYYDYLSKPVYLACEKNNTPLYSKDTISIYKEYYKLAFKCAGNDLDKWCDLYSNCIFFAYGFKQEAFDSVKSIIKDVTISDNLKYKFANTVRKFIYDCRYFNRKYVKDSDVNDLEHIIYDNIAYANYRYKYLYAFESEYKPLKPERYEEKNYTRDWEKRQKRREQEQVRIIKELKSKSDSELLTFFDLLEDDSSIGINLAISLDMVIDLEVCNVLYEINKKEILRLYFSTIFNAKGLIFAFNQLNTIFSDHSKDFKYILLKSLRVNSQFVTLLEKQSQELQNYYWGNISPFVKEDDYNFNKYCFDKLLQNGNVNAAWSLTRYNDYKLDDYLLFLQALIDFQSNGYDFYGSNYDIVSVFEKIYKLSVDDEKTQNVIAHYEMAFSKAFRNDNREIKPKFLYNQLAMNPEFSAFLIKLSYKQDNDTEVSTLTNEEIKIAENAGHILYDIKFCPCVNDVGDYHADKLGAWIDDFLAITNDNNQSKIGMHLLGKFLAHFPKDRYTTWLPKEICQSIEENKFFQGERNESLVQGFCIECYNMVGTQCINAGRENISLIAEYTSYAQAVKLEYPFCAEIFRCIAREFELESQTRRERAVHEY